jgi:hypothetical protein
MQRLRSLAAPASPGLDGKRAHAMLTISVLCCRNHTQELPVALMKRTLERHILAGAASLKGRRFTPCATRRPGVPWGNFKEPRHGKGIAGAQCGACLEARATV